MVIIILCTLSHLHTAASTADPTTPSTITAVAGSSLKLSCVLQGSPPDDARWGNGRVNYTATVTSVIHNSSTSVFVLTSLFLVLQRVMMEYGCILYQTR